MKELFILIGATFGLFLLTAASVLSKGLAIWLGLAYLGYQLTYIQSVVLVIVVWLLIPSKVIQNKD